MELFIDLQCNLHFPMLSAFQTRSVSGKLPWFGSSRSCFLKPHQAQQVSVVPVPNRSQQIRLFPGFLLRAGRTQLQGLFTGLNIFLPEALMPPNPDGCSLKGWKWQEQHLPEHWAAPAGAHSWATHSWPDVHRGPEVAPHRVGFTPQLNASNNTHREHQWRVSPDS